MKLLTLSLFFLISNLYSEEKYENSFESYDLKSFPDDVMEIDAAARNF